MGSWVNSGSRGFNPSRLSVAGFIWVRLDFLSRAPSGRRDHLGSLGFTGVRLVVAVFNRVRVGSLGRDRWLPGSFVFAWVHYGAPT